MGGSSLTKAQKREVRRLADLAYERELSRATQALQEDFARWSQGEIDVFELNERVHRFHDGPSRELYKFYCMGIERWSVAAALAQGILQPDEVDPVVLAELQPSIATAHAMAQTAESS